MENAKGQFSIRSTACKGKSSLLPPRIPSSGVPSSFSEYIPISAIGPRGLPRSAIGNPHQRSSSGSVLIEETPSWLDELLEEPDTPVRRCHRRSSSDSVAYFDSSSAANTKHVARDDCKFVDATPLSIWELQLAASQDSQHVTSSQDADLSRNTVVQNGDFIESGGRDLKGSFQNPELSHLKSVAPEPDTRRAKQQYAQRSRVRKLQYITELERNVQALQAEGCEFSAELEFLNQQNLILSMENKALKQHLESLSQEQLIKCLEHDILEREAARLRSVYQQLLMQQSTQSGHRRAGSRDLDQQLAKLSLRQKE